MILLKLLVVSFEIPPTFRLNSLAFLHSIVLLLLLIKFSKNHILIFVLLASVLDLVFAIDGSDSLLPEQFNQLKQLIKKTIDEYTISEDATRVGVMEYSDKVSIEINLKDYHQAWELKDAVDRIKASNNKGAVTDEVLRKAAEEMFITEKGECTTKI